MIPTTHFKVGLDIFRGANLLPSYRTERVVTAESALGALRLAEDFENTQVKDNEYAAAKTVLSIVDPQPAASLATVGLAEAA
jgi:hypothetical protein